MSMSSPNVEARFKPSTQFCAFPKRSPPSRSDGPQPDASGGQRPGDPEADIVVAVHRLVAAAVGRAQHPRLVDPGSVATSVLAIAGAADVRRADDGCGNREYRDQRNPASNSEKHPHHRADDDHCCARDRR